MWDTLAECNASIVFHKETNSALGQILPSPLPPHNVVWKETLAEESSNIA